MIWETFSTSSAETERLGRLLGKQLKGGEVIELRSDLGGGKTTFAKGLVLGAGSKNKVASPTFTLSRVYEAPNLTITHFDFYRLEDAGILADQLAEAINDARTITMIEWAGIVENVLPEKRISIGIQPAAGSPDERKITISYPENMADKINPIQTAWQDSEP